MQKAINMLILQGYLEDEEEEVQQLLLEVVPPVEAPAPLANDMPTVLVEKPTEDDVNMMEISAAAYHGSTSDSTISLLIQLNGVPAVALADTGSTNTFLDKQFAMDHNIVVSPLPARRVRVAGGGILLSEAISYNHQFSIQGKTFTADFRILELGGSDVVLGVNWFKLHNPVTFDFIERTLTIETAGQTHTFSDHLVHVDDLMVSAMECKQLLADQATGYVLYNIEDVRKTLSELEQIASSTEFQDILQTSAHVFQEPTGLPPHRSADHEIPLLPGSKPPNIRPYRMSHNQKNTIETIIAQMLKNGEIQSSSSPLS